MRQKTKSIVILVALLLLGVSALINTVAVKSSSPDYKVESSVLNSAGGQIASVSYISLSSTGEPTDGTKGSSPNYAGEPGFLPDSGLTPTVATVRDWLLY